MKDFEEIISGLIPAGFKFEWGTTEALPRFIRIHGGKHFPFIWSVPREDVQDEWGEGWERDAELNICTRETRDLMNGQRQSFDSILYPAWDSLAERIMGSENMEILDGTIKFQKYPEFSTNGEYEAEEKWDVLKVRFKARFYNDYKC